MANPKFLITLAALLGFCFPALAQPVTKHLYDFATPGGGGYPNDSINDHQAFVDAAAFFQTNHGYGTLILGDGEYIIGRQQLHWDNDPLPGADWNQYHYPSGGVFVQCPSLVAIQDGFTLDSCFQFTIQGGTNTSIRYRDCLYYGTFIRPMGTDSVISATGYEQCYSCEDSLHLYVDPVLLHAAVGTMFTFTHCDSITLRDVELNGNLDAAILGGLSSNDGTQTGYDGVIIEESSRCLIDHVDAHHFGRDGLLLLGGYTDTITPYASAHPYLTLSIDTSDIADSVAIWNRTVLFNNTIDSSSFNWNGRQGISWTACSGLTVTDCDLNYNGAGRFSSSPSTGLDIEGGGGPMRVRHGVFNDCRFLHNAAAGIHSDNGQCIGQEDFKFIDCLVKAGEGGSAVWPEARNMEFIGCELYGRVAEMFEQAENIPYDPDFNLVFRETNFYEEDSQWSYLKVDTSIFTWNQICSGTAHKFDMVNGGHARIHFDSCGFYTNCTGIIRFKGRSTLDGGFRYCPACNGCAAQGPYLGTDTTQDARYVTVTDCWFVNTGRKRCAANTEVVSGDYATVEGLTINIPTAVRGGGSGDYYWTPFGTNADPGPLCGSFCDGYTVDSTAYEFFPPCLPFFQDTFAVEDVWDPCTGVNVYQPPCGNYILTKTASTQEAFIDSAVTFTITVCNNTAVARPVQLTEQLPPFFTVTGSNPPWTFPLTTTDTLNNGECAVFEITGFFTEFGDYTNTVTLDPDSTVTGDELSAHAVVSVVSTCEANALIPDSSLASVVGTVFSGTVDIQGLFIVDDDVLFQNAQVFMEPGAEIIVQDGWMLDIISSSFTACNGVMWKSITATDGSTVRIISSFMDDAESTIAALDGSTVWVKGTQFHNNRVAIGIPENGLPYNDVACFVARSTFYSMGSMPAPYPGQTTDIGAQGFAAADVHNTEFDFTGGNNIIHTMSNGIVANRSDVSVSGCTMQNIHPDAAYAYVGNGAGIYARGGKGFYTLKQQGFGMSGPPSFEDCRWGVYTEYMNVKSTQNKMLDMGTAYRVDRSGYRNVDILNNTVSTHYHGIDLRFNDGAAHILVEGNDITFGDYPSGCATCRGFSAILVTEGNYAMPDAKVIHNTIHFLPMAASRFGINLNTADDWLVAENTLLMAHNQFNRTGVQLNSCNRPEVSCNIVKGGDNGYPLDAQAAIRNALGSDVLISCNDVDSTANGILFNYVTPNTDVRGNHFHNHRWPLHLDSTAVIGGQTLKGNLWDPNAGTPVVGAWYEVSDVQSAQSLFLFNPAMISGGSTQPPSWSPQDWFDFSFGSNYDCSDDEGEDYCTQFHERGKERLTELDVHVANDSLENDPYTNETTWMLKGRLYKKLDENPELLDSLEVVTDFYEELQGSTTADFQQIDDDQLTLYDIDSNVVAQLQADRAQVDSLMALVQDGLEELGDSTLTAVQRQVMLASISAFRQNGRDLSTASATALEGVASSKALSASSVQTANAAVVVSELIERNQKTVNDIYLAAIGKDVDTFTADQTDDLFAVANQCPMIGGNAVFKARSLYWLFDDSYDFDDASLCLPYGIIVKRLVESEPNAFSVVPNPASDEAILVIAKPLNEPGVFIIYDGIGVEVMRHTVSIETPRLSFSTASLAPALYHYQVRGPSGVIGVGKLTIVR